MTRDLRTKQSTPARPSASPIHGLLQRKCACGNTSATGECEACKKKRPGLLQRSAVTEAPVPEVPPIVHEVLASSGRPLDRMLRHEMENRFSSISAVSPVSSSSGNHLQLGRSNDSFEREADSTAQQVMQTETPSVTRSTAIDFSRVRVHTGGDAAESANVLNANAYTNDQRIVFASGAYSPSTASGRRLLAHELTHVLQQQTSSHVVQRQVADEGFGIQSADFAEEGWQDVNELGIVYQPEGANLRDRPLPEKDGSKVLFWVPQNTKVFILRHSPIHNWYFVSAGSQVGYVYDKLVWRNLPEPDVLAYRVEPGQTPLDVARLPLYEEFRGWGKDKRYVVNALVYVNSLAEHNGTGQPGIAKPQGDVTKPWSSAETKEAVYIWLPSPDFLKRLYPKVVEHGGGTGSITADLWESAKKVGKALVYSASFVGGLVHGFGKSLYDAVKGAIDLVVSIFTGSILSDAVKLWEAVKNLTWEDMKAAFGAWAKEWGRKLTSDDPFEAGHAFGYLVGYLIGEAAQTFLTGGALAALKGARWATRIGKIVSDLPGVARMQKAVVKAGNKLDEIRDTLKSKTAAQAKRALTRAQAWAREALDLSTELATRLTTSDISKLRRLPAEVIQRIRGGTQKYKRRILRCNSPCNVDVNRIMREQEFSETPRERLEDLHPGATGEPDPVAGVTARAKGNTIHSLAERLIEKRLVGSVLPSHRVHFEGKWSRLENLVGKKIDWGTPDGPDLVLVREPIKPGRPYRVRIIDFTATKGRTKANDIAEALRSQVDRSKWSVDEGIELVYPKTSDYKAADYILEQVTRHMEEFK